jgi:hypothetical protein
VEEVRSRLKLQNRPGAPVVMPAPDDTAQDTTSGD